MHVCVIAKKTLTTGLSGVQERVCVTTYKRMDDRNNRAQPFDISILDFPKSLVIVAYILVVVFLNVSSLLIRLFCPRNQPSSSYYYSP
jgi:hypothetical protein